MIVKNEMVNLERCLSAVAPYITCWVIGDTGSTDGTQAFIQQFFAERGIPGELHSFPFENFAQARNEALERARSSSQKFDYLLFTDADMEFVAHDPRFAEKLKQSAYKLLQQAGVSYWNLRILRRSTPATYRGVTHEFLDVQSGRTENLQSASYIDHGTGANRFEKYDRDARLLTAAIAAENDPAMISRYTFYLANTLRDSEQKEAALEVYERRAEQGHWQQEVFISLLNAAKIKEELSYQPDEVLSAYAKASSICLDRAEAHHAAARYCRDQRLFKKGYELARHGITIKYPRDALFVEDWVYDYGLLDELAICAYWCEKYGETVEVCDQVLGAEKVPSSMRPRIEANRKHAIERLAEIGISEALYRTANQDPLFGRLTPSDRNWIALWSAARAYRDAGDEEKFRRTALSAFQKRPLRGEPLYDLARYYRERGLYAESVIFCEQGLAIYNDTKRQTLSEILCIVGLHEELSIASNYSPDPNQKKRGFQACDWLALARCVPDPQRALARSNLRFYVESADKFLPSIQSTKVQFRAPEGYHPSNPSITRRGQDLFIAQRCVNYTLSEHNDYLTENQEPIQTRNFLLKLSEDFLVEVSQEIHPPSDLPEPKSTSVRGFEDLRLFEWQGSLWCSAAVLEFSADKRAIQVLSRVDFSKDGICRLADWSIMDAGGPPRNEKNWMPFVKSDSKSVDFGELQFIYLCDPTTVIDHNSKIKNRQDAPISAEQFRGGSQLVPFANGYLGLVHEVLWIPQENRRQYHHRFVWFDENYQLSAISRPFYFQKQGVEFAAGLAWHQDEKRLIISYAVDDGDSWIAHLQASDVCKSLFSTRPIQSALPLPKFEGSRSTPLLTEAPLSPIASISSIAPYLIAADSPADRRDLSRPYDANVMRHLDTDRGRGLPPIHCFYEVLDETADHRTLHAAVLSMCAAGHAVQVWSYSPSKLSFLRDTGVVLGDAADIIPRRLFERVISMSEIRYFSDIFRYAVLYELGGIWMDGDIVLIRPFGFRGDYFFNLQWSDGGKGHLVCGNVIYAPVNSPHIRALYESAIDILLSSDTRDFGEVGPKLLSDYLLSAAGADLRKWVCSPMFFNSIDWTETDLFGEEISHLSTYLHDDRVVGVHLWNARTHSLSNADDRSLIFTISNPMQPLPKLSDAFDRFQIDRNRNTGNRHCYARVYERILGHRRFSLSGLLEIGLHSGLQSAEAWKTYFPYCHVISLDPQNYADVKVERFTPLETEISGENEIRRFSELVRGHRFELIVDNGSHRSIDQQLALVTLFGQLEVGGWYFIESLDWQPDGEDAERVSKTKELLQEIKSNRRPERALDPAGVFSIARDFEEILFFDSLYELGRANLIGGLVAIKKRGEQEASNK